MAVSKAKPGLFRLASGLELLDSWSQDATQAEKNMVHQVLFSLVSRTVFTEYDVIDDAGKTMEFFVLAPGGLTVKIRVFSLDAFGIVYIGPACDAEGLGYIAPDTDLDAEVLPGQPGPREEHGLPHPG